MLTVRELIDKTRQRLLTDHELTFVARHARRMEIGAGIAESAGEIENSIIPLIVQDVQNQRSNEENLNSDGWNTLKGLVTLAVRQVLFANAMDDGTRLKNEIKLIYKLLWKIEVQPATIEMIFESLRDRLIEQFSNHEFRQLDQYLRLAHLSMVSAAAIGSQKKFILQRSITDVFNKYTDWEKQDHTLRRRLTNDMENMLMLAIRCILPQGDEQAAKELMKITARFEKDARYAKGINEMMGFVAANLTERTESRYILKVNAIWGQFTNFLKVSYDLNDKKSSLVLVIWKKLSEAHGTNLKDMKDAQKVFKAESEKFITACAKAIVPGGIEYYHKDMGELDKAVYHRQLPSELTNDWLDLILESAASALSPESYGHLSYYMDASRRYLSVAGDFAVSRDDILMQIADQIAEEYPKVFQAKPRYKLYVVRDHVALLDTIYWSLLPKSDLYVSGRIAIFGDIIIADKFPSEMMLRSFDILEETVKTNFSDQVAGIILPLLKNSLDYYRATVELVTAEGKILKEASEGLFDKYAPEIDKFKDGREKVKLDARTLLRACAASIIPGGEHDLYRGMVIFNENNQDMKFPTEMIKEHMNGLYHAAQNHLSPESFLWLGPILNQCKDYCILSSQLAQIEQDATAEAIERVFKRYPEVEVEHMSARRHLSNDYYLFLKYALPSNTPGGQFRMAENLSILYDVYRSEKLPGNYIKESYKSLEKVVMEKLGSEMSGLASEQIQRVGSALTAVGEMAENAQGIIDSALNAPNITGGIENDDKLILNNTLQTIVKFSGLTGFEGGQKLFAHKLRITAPQAAQSGLTPQVFWEALNQMNVQAKKFLTEESAAIVCKAIDSARDYLSLVCSIGKVESEILRDAVEKAAKSVGVNGVSEKIFRGDGRLLLHSSLYATLPGGKEDHEYVLRMLSTVYRHHRKGNEGVLTATFEHLKASFQQYVKVGPVQELNETIDKSVKAALAA